MLTVHHLNNSRSQRILWLLEELEVEYEIKQYQRLATQRAPPELLKIHPLGKSPVITDGEVTLAESGAIIEYILQKYGKGRLAPPEGTGAIDNLYFLHYAEGSVMPVLVNKLIFTLAPTYSPWFIRPLVRFIFGQVSAQFVEPEVKKHVKLIEAHLEKKEWFAGGSEPTSADFAMAMVMEIFEHYKYAGPATVAYVKRMQDRSALKKGGEYAYGPKL